MSSVFSFVFIQWSQVKRFPMFYEKEKRKRNRKTVQNKNTYSKTTFSISVTTDPSLHLRGWFAYIMLLAVSKQGQTKSLTTAGCHPILPYEVQVKHWHTVLPYQLYTLSLEMGSDDDVKRRLALKSRNILTGQIVRIFRSELANTISKRISTLRCDCSDKTQLLGKLMQVQSCFLEYNVMLLSRTMNAYSPGVVVRAETPQWSCASCRCYNIYEMKWFFKHVFHFFTRPYTIIYTLAKTIFL